MFSASVMEEIDEEHANKSAVEIRHQVSRDYALCRACPGRWLVSRASSLLCGATCSKARADAALRAVQRALRVFSITYFLMLHNACGISWQREMIKAF